MKSLFNPTHNQEILDRLNTLTPETHAKWGKMNVAQMLTHCQAAINLAFGNVKLKQNIIGILFSSIPKKMVIYSGKPMKKKSPHC
jgi:hypothetical protein